MTAEPLTLDDAGVVRTVDGVTVAVLEPELEVRLVAAILASPRLARALELRARAHASTTQADQASPEAMKALREQAAGDRGAADGAEHLAGEAMRAGVDAVARVGGLPADGCTCRGECGEEHLGGVCALPWGARAYRRLDAPGIWTQLPPSNGKARAVVGVVRWTKAGPRCQRCAWLAARREGVRS